MEQSLIRIFTHVREHFPEVKENVSLLKPYLELAVLSPGLTLKTGEFEQMMGHKPEILYQSSNEEYAISVLYRVDDELTRGVIAYQFAEVLARERSAEDHAIVDAICVERGFGENLLYAFMNDVFPGMIDKEFIRSEEVEDRIQTLRKLLGY